MTTTVQRAASVLAVFTLLFGSANPTLAQGSAGIPDLIAVLARGDISSIPQDPHNYTAVFMVLSAIGYAQCSLREPNLSLYGPYIAEIMSRIQRKTEGYAVGPYPLAAALHPRYQEALLFLGAKGCNSVEVQAVLKNGLRFGLGRDPVDFSGALPLIESKSKVYDMQNAFADSDCKGEGRTNPACANFIAFIYGKSEPFCFHGLVIPAAPNPPQVISCWYAPLADKNKGRRYVFWYERTPGNLDAHWVHGKYQLSEVIPVAVTQCPGDDDEAHNLSLRAPPMNQASSTSVSYTLPASGEPSPCDVVLEAPSAEVPMAFAEGDYALVDRVTPVYPARALSGGMEGYVDMSFTVTEIGAVKEPIITFSTSSIFDRAATRTVLKYKYKPRVVDGQPIEVKGVTTRITFEIEE